MKPVYPDDYVLTVTKDAQKRLFPVSGSNHITITHEGRCGRATGPFPVAYTEPGEHHS